LVLAPLFLPRPSYGQDEVQVSAEAAHAKVTAGDRTVIAVVIDHAPGFHSWPSADQDVLPPDIAAFAQRTKVVVGSLEGTAIDEVNVGELPPEVSGLGDVQWPVPHLAPVPDFSGENPTVDVPAYSGRAVVYIPIAFATDAKGAFSLPISVFYQACNESVCLIPETREVTVNFEFVPAGAERPPVDESLFGNFDPAGYTTIDVPVQEKTPVASSKRTFFGLAVPDWTSPVGLAVITILAAVGGFILNLTPCVLPVIPLKVMAISSHAGSPGKSLALGIWMALGVVGFWVGIGLPVAFFASVTDPSRLFGIWWVTLGIGLLIALMGVGIMGLFNINLPQSVYKVNPKLDTPGGSFMFGIMTAVLGLPCFGFVAGALLAGAATMPAHVVMLIFLGLGVGMAAPYLVLSAKPSLVEQIPRTGPASILVKEVMGLLLLSAAAYFVGSGVLALVGGMDVHLPWWGKVVHWWAVGLFALAAGAWLLIRTIQITPKPLPRAAFSFIGIVIAGVAILWSVNETAKARDNFWIPFDESALTAALDDGQIVVVDFTAEWCINCKFLKATVLTRGEVRKSLTSDEVTPLVADLTSNSAPGWKKLSELGQSGIPLLVIYGPGLDEPWMANSYTPDTVLAALERAKGATTASAR
jgi:thiol:disulfide interchange protein